MKEHQDHPSFKYVAGLLLVVLLWACGGSTPTADKTASGVPPNIIFIAVDDLRPELGVYGGQAKTPYMDALAKDGVLFNKHYVQVPTCGASRYALLTGYRPSKRAHLANDVFYHRDSAGIGKSLPKTFIHQLRENGYRTLGIGKISHSADGYVYGYNDETSTQRELPLSWDVLRFDEGPWKTGWKAFFAYANGRDRQTENHQVKPYEMADVDDQGYPDGRTAQLAIKTLDSLKNTKNPFFLGLGFFKPHLPFTGPKKYWDLYEPANIVLAENGDVPKNHIDGSLHQSSEFNRYAAGEEKAALQTPLSPSYAKKIKHAYLAATSYVDAQVGAVVERLKATGLYENSIIVLWGDHGWHLGEQRIWGKHTLFESSLRSTLMIKAPGMAADRTVEGIVETVDLFPTLMELSKIPNSAKDGESLVPYLSKERNRGVEKQTAFSYYRNGISMRRQRYRLTKYYRDNAIQTALYDLERDAGETENIAKDHPEILQALDSIFQKGATGIYR